MRSERHEAFEGMIDRSLVDAMPVAEEQSLREHLESCVQCQEYLSASKRVISSIGGFSFDVDPTLNAKVAASLVLRAEQLAHRRRLVVGCILAVVLTAAGSFLELEFGGLIAAVLDIERMQVRQGLFAFWIVPSLFVLLLFPLLPLLLQSGARRNERIL
jgi:hypothetical protein